MKTYLLGLCAILFAISSCCDPKPRDSSPLVIDTSYSLETVKDARIPVPPDNLVDSGYYPIYSLDIKNIGSEADTFRLVFYPPYNGQYVADPGYILSDAHYVQPGETKTFRTYGPIPSNALDTAKTRYYLFFASTPDSADLSILRPLVRIYYGKSIDGPETCGMPETSTDVAIDKLRK